MLRAPTAWAREHTCPTPSQFVMRFFVPSPVAACFSGTSPRQPGWLPGRLCHRRRRRRRSLAANRAPLSMAAAEWAVGNGRQDHSPFCRAKASRCRLNTSTARTKYSTVLLSASVVGWPLALSSAMSWRRLDECFEFADLVIQLRKTIGLHRDRCPSDLRPAYVGDLTTCKPLVPS